MSKRAEHTPGPWALQPIGDETECNILGAGRELIATVSDNDARLIAAAPDLLAALETLTASLAWEAKRSKTTYSGYENALAAIAKATGGAA